MNKQPAITRQKFPLVFCSCVLFLIFAVCGASLAGFAILSPSIYKSVSATYYAARAGGNYTELNFEAALPDYTRAIQLKPDFYEAYVFRGSTYAHLENYEQAKLDYEAAIDLYPSRADAYNSLCWFGSLLGDAVNVLDACEQAVTIEPNNHHYRDSRGLARALTGDYPGAILDFQFYVEQAGTDPYATSGDVKERLLWISSLRKGNDPFDSAELKKLLDNNSLPDENPQQDI